MGEPKAAPVRGCTANKLRRLTRRVTQHYDHVLAAAGLRVTQFSLLQQLANAGPLPMSALAAHLEMDRTTLTRNLGPLVASGWVALSPGEDARVREVSIAPKGVAVLERARVLWRAAQDGINRRLGAGQVAALHALLDDSLARLREDMEEGEPA